MFCCHIVSEYFSNLTVNLVEVGQRGQKNNKNIHFKKGILQQILVLLP